MDSRKGLKEEVTDVKESLEKRGETLEELNDSVAQLEKASGLFAESAKQLREAIEAKQKESLLQRITNKK